MPHHDPENDPMLPQQIMSCLRGEMSAEEEKAFLDGLRSDPDRKALAEAIVRMVSAMRAEGRKSDREIIEAIAALSPDEAAPTAASPFVRKPKRKFFRHIAWIYSVAAVSICFVVIVAINFFKSNASRGLGDEYFLDLDSEFVRGEENDSIYEELDELFAQVRYGQPDDQTVGKLAAQWKVLFEYLTYYISYSRLHYDDVVPVDTLKQRPRKDGPITPKKPKGPIHRSKREMRERIIFTNRLLENCVYPYLDFAPEIGWNLAVAYLKMNDRENALKVLKQLRELYSDNIGFTEKIDELEGKIRDI